jgi:hypothetical protein
MQGHHRLGPIARGVGRLQYRIIAVNRESLLLHRLGQFGSCLLPRLILFIEPSGRRAQSPRRPNYSANPIGGSLSGPSIG